MRHLRLAFRTLFRTPFVTSVAMISLALGIGANTAIFSLFNQMLLRPLPVHDPGELVNLSSPGPKPGSQSCGPAGDCESVFSYQMFRDLERSQTVFSGIAAHTMFGANLAYRNQTLNGQGMLVSGGYFPTLGITPVLGRLLGPDDDRSIGGNFVAVLSHRYWQTRLGSDASVIGSPIVVNGRSMTIVGVAAAGFDGTTLGTQPAVFVPLTMRGLMLPGWEDFDERRSYWAYLFARLKPGETIAKAKAGIDAVYKPIINDIEAPLQKGMSDATLKRFRAKEIVLESGALGQSNMHQEARTPLFLLLATTGIVLLIACANIANLLLARGANRGMEMAVRLSLGAGRAQLFGQLILEATLLAVLGGALSLLVAQWTLSAIQSILPSDALATLHFSLEPEVLAFAALLSVGTGFLFGAFPALQSTRPDLVTTLRANSGKHSSSRGAARFRTSLVTAQIALSMALLVTAGLFVRSLVNVTKVDLGLRADHVVTFAVSPELNAYEPFRSREFFRRLRDALAGLPGVTGVTTSTVPLLGDSNWGSSVHVEGFQSGPDVDNGSRYSEVGANYASTLGITLLAGREFTDADDLDRPKVAIVNEAFASKFNLGRNVIGKHMAARERDSLDIEIVGLVKDAKYSSVKDKVPPLFYVPYRQDSTVGSMYYYVRTSLAPELMLRTVSGVVTRLDPNLPVEDLKTLPQQVQDNVFLDRMISTLSAAFAILATMLAAIGLYGVLAFTVAQRTNEIGVRMALGADSSRVRGMVLRQVGLMTIIGGTIGAAGAIGMGKAAGSLLYGVTGNDPGVIVLAAVLLGAVALAAGYVPARRASRIAPMQALRYE